MCIPPPKFMAVSNVILAQYNKYVRAAQTLQA